MLCPRCGYYSEAEGSVCPECGEILKNKTGERYEGKAEAIRQGKRARQAYRKAAEERTREEEEKKRRGGASRATIEMPRVQDTRGMDEDGFYAVSEEEEEEDRGYEVFERRNRPVYDDEAALEEQAETYAARYSQSRRLAPRTINWIKIGCIITGVIMTLALAAWLFVDKTEEGQKLLAWAGRDATSSALWSVGEDKMNNGDISGAIECFERAAAQEAAMPEPVVDPDGLLMLASAYEAAGRADDAEALYEQIYTDTPSRTEAYTNRIRILLARRRTGDLAAAGELMKLAYEKTGDSSFRLQRDELLPAPPEVDLTGGYYEEKKRIALTSYQGYEVWYTFEPEEKATLPEDGKLFTGRIPLDEGTHNLRAVAVNGELVSDELRGTYKIYMPKPQAPRCNLAPGTYKNRQTVKLKPGKDNENDDDIVIYYTVDGSNPDSDSPIYTGEAIVLPTGYKVTIKAMAVNQYGKMSNIMEVSFKIEAKPWPETAWNWEERIAGLELNKATYADFQATYGEPLKTETIEVEGFESECRKLTYDWGYAVINLAKKTWVVEEIYFTAGEPFKAPRGTGVGDTLEFVISKFKDLGQIEVASGNRGLYALLDKAQDGKIWKQEDGTKIIRYREKHEGHYYMLEYYVGTNGTVYAVDYRFIP